MRDKLAWRKRKTGLLRAASRGASGGTGISESSEALTAIGAASGNTHRMTKRVRTGY